MQRLFDSLKDGLLILSPVASAVIYANQAARKMLPVTLGEPFSGVLMQSQIIAIQRGYLKTPLTFEIDLPGQNQPAEQIQITLLPSPVGNDFVAILKKNTHEHIYENVINNFAEMLDCEFHDPMQEFLNATIQMLSLFESTTEENWALRESVARVHRISALLEGRLQQIGLLASTFKEAPMRDEERIVVPELINEMLASTNALLTEQGIRVSFSGVNDSLPVIYASRNFLAQALAGYLRHLLERIDHGVNILISAKNKGNFILLSIENYGKCAPPGKSRLAPTPVVSAWKSSNPETRELSLLLCKRVVELSGGSLHIDESAAEVNKITFELPVSAPAGSERETGHQQAQRYAQDLLTLMQRQASTTQTLRK